MLIWESSSSGAFGSSRTKAVSRIRLVPNLTLDTQMLQEVPQKKPEAPSRARHRERADRRISGATGDVSITAPGDVPVHWRPRIHLTAPRWTRAMGPRREDVAMALEATRVSSANRSQTWSYMGRTVRVGALSERR